ncbi:MAG: phage terminase large subunit family protein [Proteobacteria bacterium]|nr:phage terminase large subunit family protein [Pseudomonadota bacterium]
MNVVEQTFRQSAPLPDDEEIWDWAARHCDFGTAEAKKGRYNVANYPWTKDWLRAFRDPTVRQIGIYAPPQESGKTTAAQVCMGWRIDRMPAKMAFNTTTNVKAKKWSETRWDQTVTYMPVIADKFAPGLHKQKKDLVKFVDGTFLMIQGAEVDANRQSDTIEVQINDERMLWERPWASEMHNRTLAYLETRKILDLGLGGKTGTEWHEQWLEGTQKEWSHHCPKCRRIFQYIFDHKNPKCSVRFDLTKARLYSDGRLDLREFEPTIHIRCPHCAEKFGYDAELWERMNAEGEYVQMNPTADPKKETFHVNAFAIGRRPFVEILKPWVRMNLRGGIFNMEALQTFITHELCEFWEDRPIVVNADVKLGSYHRADVLQPPVFKDGKCVSGWADEWIRVLVGDNQQGEKGDVKHRWFLCRAFSKDGRSRLVDCGRLDHWESVEDKRKELGVPAWSEDLPGPWVAFDRRFDPIEVDDICSRYRWYGMMGADRPYFLHGPASEHAGKQMPFSEEQYVDVGFGTSEQGRKHAIYYYFASQRVQDFLALLRGGKAETWELPADLASFCPEYVEHINAHRQKVVEGKNGTETRVWYKLSGWDDHLNDCEQEAVVLGLMAGVFVMPETAPQPTE